MTAYPNSRWIKSTCSLLPLNISDKNCCHLSAGASIPSHSGAAAPLPHQGVAETDPPHEPLHLLGSVVPKMLVPLPVGGLPFGAPSSSVLSVAEVGGLPFGALSSSLL